MTRDEPKRDPRINPKPGDVVRKCGVERRVVRIFGGSKHPCMDVRFRRGLGSEHGIFPYLSQWRRWAKGAVVIHVSPD